MKPYQHNAFAGYIGVAKEDITPPSGIYARNWGAASHDAATGIERPMRAVAMTLQSNAQSEPLVMISLDLGWWKTTEDEWHIRGAVLEALQLDESRVIVSVTHTHSGPSTLRHDSDKAGGELIAPYLQSLREAVVSVVQRALRAKVLSTLTWDYGQCNLARNRDLPDPQGSRVVCGFNPDAPADETLLVGRVCDKSGKVLLTIANYACHPTTLAWQNTLISPDWVGSFYETVENVTGGLAMFWQGASGELQPARTYTDDLETITRQGRQLGFATLSVLEGMLPPEQSLHYDGVVESGAPLACWKSTFVPSNHQLEAKVVELELPLKKDWPSLEELRKKQQETTDRALSERLARAMCLRQIVGEGKSTFVRLWKWKIGDCTLFAHSNEAYSLLQQTLRKEYAPNSVAVLNLCNGASLGYLPPSELYEKDIYQVWQTPLAQGCLEQMIETALSLE